MIKTELYDMESDPGETTSLYRSHLEIAGSLFAQLESDVASGHSTFGVDQTNDVEVEIRKSKRKQAKNN